METPSKQEWLILEALWDKSPMFLSDIVDVLGSELTWKPTTYQTYLRRMCAKGLLGSEKVRGSYSYFPLVSRDDCIRNESRFMISKLKGSSAKLFLANMIEESELDEQDARELRDIIDRLSGNEQEAGE